MRQLSSLKRSNGVQTPMIFGDFGTNQLRNCDDSARQPIPPSLPPSLLSLSLCVCVCVCVCVRTCMYAPKLLHIALHSQKVEKEVKEANTLAATSKRVQARTYTNATRVEDVVCPCCHPTFLTLLLYWNVESVGAP